MFFKDEVLDRDDKWHTISCFCATVAPRWKQDGFINQSFIWLLGLCSSRVVIEAREDCDGVLPTDTKQQCEGALGGWTRFLLVHWARFEQSHCEVQKYHLYLNTCVIFPSTCFFLNVLPSYLYCSITVRDKYLCTQMYAPSVCAFYSVRGVIYRKSLYRQLL